MAWGLASSRTPRVWGYRPCYRGSLGYTPGSMGYTLGYTQGLGGYTLFETLSPLRDGVHTP